MVMHLPGARQPFAGGQTVDTQTIQIRILQEEGITHNIEYIRPLLPAYVQNG